MKSGDSQLIELVNLESPSGVALGGVRARKGVLRSDLAHKIGADGREPVVHEVHDAPVGLR